MGLLMEKELQYLEGELEKPARPFLVILGGSKVSDKIGVIKALMKRADVFLVGGAMAYTFYRALGIGTGKSRVEADKVDLALEILALAKEKGVNVPPVILAHLHDTPSPPLAAITAPHQPPSNDWRDYTWRYALCQMLLDNPNYADRFRALAVALMEGQPGVSFESVYGPVSREVAFEFEQFLTHVGNGSRADLTAWPWKAKQRRLAPGGVGRAKVKGAAGWQASGVEVEAGAVYVITAEGSWSMAADAESTGPEGDAAGRGRLAGALYADFTLTQEIPLGSHTSWIAPADGLLMLRAADAWTELADNDGTLSITIRRGEAP
jgi:hypothetical protein